MIIDALYVYIIRCYWEYIGKRERRSSSSSRKIGLVNERKVIAFDCLWNEPRKSAFCFCAFPLISANASTFSLEMAISFRYRYLVSYFLIHVSIEAQSIYTHKSIRDEAKRRRRRRRIIAGFNVNDVTEVTQVRKKNENQSKSQCGIYLLLHLALPWPTLYGNQMTKHFFSLFCRPMHWCVFSSIQNPIWNKTDRLKDKNLRKK